QQPRPARRAHHLTRPNRDIVNVSTIDPRRTVTLRFDTPYPRPRGSYTAESRLAPRETPYTGFSARRRMVWPSERNSTDPCAVSNTTATVARRVIASWRAAENAAPNSPVAARTAAAFRRDTNRGATSARSSPAIAVA